jgi:Arc/MetJ-type ribon-helix-helix transcriptional regulator
MQILPSVDDDSSTPSERKFSLDDQTVRLILSLTRLTEAPSYSEQVRQCVLLTYKVSQYFLKGYELVVAYNKRKSEVFDSKPVSVQTTPVAAKGLSKNKRRQFNMTDRTSHMLREIKASIGFRSNSEALRYAVRLYYAAATASIDEGKVFLRTSAGEEREVLIFMCAANYDFTK